MHFKMKVPNPLRYLYNKSPRGQVGRVLFVISVLSFCVIIIFKQKQIRSFRHKSFEIDAVLWSLLVETNAAVPE